VLRLRRGRERDLERESKAAVGGAPGVIADVDGLVGGYEDGAGGAGVAIVFSAAAVNGLALYAARISCRCRFLV
jgi:hypothetical protein